MCFLKYLFEGQNHKERFFIVVLLPQMATMARPRPCENQELGIPSKSSTQVVQVQEFGSNFVDFQGSLGGS